MFANPPTSLNSNTAVSSPSSSQPRGLLHHWRWPPVLAQQQSFASSCHTIPQSEVSCSSHRMTGSLASHDIHIEQQGMSTGHKPSPLSRLVSKFRKSRSQRMAAHLDRNEPASMTATSEFNQQGPSHLIVLANGLFGTPANWTTIITQLSKKLDTREVLVHASAVNKKTDTYDGIDVCGWRLADEIKSVVERHPSLTRISVIGHSMGGLLLRYAIGVSYDPTTGKIAGLEPCHFITMATPHLGCDAEGVSQVPFIGWLSVAQPIQNLLSAVSVPIGSLLFRRTGKQFFLADDDNSRMQGTAGLPLLARMTHDVPERSEYFMSALCSFASRTAYANTGQDHLVGWANSSLRFMHQLPSLPSHASNAKGVVLEDPLLAAFDARFKPQAEPQSATNAEDVPVRHSGEYYRHSSGDHHKQSTSSHRSSSMPRAISQASTTSTGYSRQMSTSVHSAASGLSSASMPSNSSTFVEPAAQLAGLPSAMSGGIGSIATSSQKPSLDSTSKLNQNRINKTVSSSRSHQQEIADDTKSLVKDKQLVEEMLQRLQSLAWRRIDVCFKGAALPFAHNHIQVTRRWLNFEGESVAIHLAEQVAALDSAYVALKQKDNTLAHLERRSSSERSAGPSTAEPWSLASMQAVRAALQENSQNGAKQQRDLRTSGSVTTGKQASEIPSNNNEHPGMSGMQDRLKTDKTNTAEAQSSSDRAASSSITWLNDDKIDEVAETDDNVGAGQSNTAGQQTTNSVSLHKSRSASSMQAMQ